MSFTSRDQAAIDGVGDCLLSLVTLVGALEAEVIRGSPKAADCLPWIAAARPAVECLEAAFGLLTNPHGSPDADQACIDRIHDRLAAEGVLEPRPSA